jgi:hypothetical protein
MGLPGLLGLKYDGPTIPIGRIVENRVCGMFGLVIAEGVNPLIPSVD